MNPNQLWFMAMLVLVVVLLSIVYIEHDDVVGRALLVSVLMAMVLQRVLRIMDSDGGTLGLLILTGRW